ncbi:Pentatricopeptide repeat-containing protein [Vitis vinifera]|uniref:Pentatricopeptide repeat-containing protein n=1 Tax=Vitis vinifera TaxID=29760 RepID=A0A438D062_VITVI|nr:Pentatricopeptide repeat-containing protein [Vitis vinifera]
MAVKLSSLTLSSRIPIWVPLIASMSSISCANRIQAVPEIDQTKTPPNDNEFEPKFQFLRNRLMPDDLIRVLDTTHDLNSAIKVFKWASRQKRFRHTADTYFRVILKLGMGGKIEDMEAFCSEMVREKCPGGEETLIALISSFVKHRRLSEAIRVLVIMTSNGYKFSIIEFNGLLGALVRERRDFREILLVYKEIVKAGIVPNVDTLNYLIEALFELNWIDLALDQYRRMSKKGCSPNSKTFDILISGLIARNLVEKSVVVLGEMIELECEADLSFYTSVIPLFCSVHQVEEGMMLFWRMRASKLVPDLLIYRVLIQCLSESLWLDDAINLLEEMIGCGLTLEDDVFVYIVKEGYCTAGDFHGAKVFLEKIFDRNIIDNFSWNILVRWLCENAWTSKAFELLSRMIVSSFTPDSATYSALVIGNCKLSKCKDGLELFHQMERIQEAAEVFCYMSSNRCALKSSSLDMLMKGKDSDILVVLSKMLVEGCILDVEAYCILVQSMCALSRTEDIARFFNLMVSEGLVPDSETVATLLSFLTKHSQLHTILTAIGKLASDGEILNSSMYNLLIIGLLKEGYKSEACRLLDLMLEKGWVPDASTHGLLIGSVVSEVPHKEAVEYENSCMQDKIGNILAEGLRET